MTDRQRSAVLAAAVAAGFLLSGYMVGRLHQRDVVALCHETAVNVSRMLDAYEQASVQMWRVLTAPGPVP